MAKQKKSLYIYSFFTLIRGHMIKISLFLVFLSLPLLAQKKPSPPKSSWKKEAVSNFNFSNSSYRDWKAGGEDATTWTLKFQGFIEKDWNKKNWKTAGKLGFGMTKSDKDFRKSLDEIFLESIGSYKLTKLLNPYISASLQSQFSKGYKYTDSSQAVISNFWDPGYLIQSAGLGLKPYEQLTTRLGFSLKETFSPDHKFADDIESTNKVETFKIEPGLESITESNFKFNKIIKYESKLSVFINFKSVDEVDGRWENLITAQISKYININFGYELLYDKDMFDSSQRKQDLSIGLNYNFI